MTYSILVLQFLSIGRPTSTSLSLLV